MYIFFLHVCDACNLETFSIYHTRRVFGYIHDLPSGTHITYLLLSLVVAYGGLDIMCIHMGNFTCWTSMLNYKCKTGMLCISI